MSFNLVRKTNCAWIEYTQSSVQTISSGTDITWDTKRSTGGDSVSINSSTGVITLDSSKRYWIQASVNVDRSASGNIEFTFQTGAGGSLTQAQGAFPMLYVEDTTLPIINSSFVASLMVVNPSTTYKLRCVTVDASSTLEAETHLFIMEFS